MPKYAVVNGATGEMDADCPYCVLFAVSGDMDDAEIAIFESQTLPDGHIMIEITNEERDKLREVQYIVNRNGKEETVFHVDELTMEERESAKIENAYLIDLAKAEAKIKDRAIIETPVVFDGLGGREISPVEYKPAGIVLEKDSRAKLEN